MNIQEIFVHLLINLEVNDDFKYTKDENIIILKSEEWYLFL